MTNVPRDDQALRFATQIFDLLDRASTTSTYKYGVLLGLLECCQRQVQRDGSVPDVVTTRQLAEAVVDIYWAQTKPCSLTGDVLSQNSGRQAKIVSLIGDLRQAHGGMTSPHRVKLSAAEDFEKMVCAVEWTLVQMPLPKLQRIGGNVDEFLYTIAWDDHVKKRASGFSDYQLGKTSDFDNRLLMRPGVGDFLVRLGPLLRPLVQREWARTVAGFNNLTSDALESFLFEQQRQSLAALAAPLEEAQEGVCFYCDEPLGQKAQVDHFVPWSRAPNDELHNFVLAHDTCNNSKSNHLAAVRHLRRWVSRNDQESREGQRFVTATTQLLWPVALDETTSVARSVYFTVPNGMLLWASRRQFAPADAVAIARALG